MRISPSKMMMSNIFEGYQKIILDISFIINHNIYILREEANGRPILFTTTSRDRKLSGK